MANDRILAVLALLMLVPAVSQCASNDDPQPSAGAGADNSLATAPAISTAAVPVPGSYEISASILPGTIAEATEYERQLIADGVLSFADYERYVLDTIACLEDGGLVVMHDPNAFESFDGVSRTTGLQGALPGPMLGNDGSYHYLPTSREPEALSRVVGACQEEYGRTINRLWAQHVAPDELDLNAYRAAMGQCIRDAGHDAPESPSAEELLAIRQANGPGSDPEWYSVCERRITAEFETR